MNNFDRKSKNQKFASNKKNIYLKTKIIMNNFIEKEKSTIILLKILWLKLRRKRRRQLVFLTILMFISTLAEVVSLASVVPFLSVLVDPQSLWDNDFIKNLLLFSGVKDQNEMLFPITILFVTASIFSAVIRLLNIWINGRVAAAIGSDLSIEAYEKTLYQPYKEHLRNNSSKLISTISQDVNLTIFNIIRPSLEFISSILITIGIVSTLFLINFSAAFCTGLIILATYFFSIKINSNSLRIVSINVVSFNRKLIKLLQEGLGGIREIILDRTQNIYSEFYSKTDRPLRKFEAKRAFLSYYPRLLLEPLGTSLIAILGFALVKNGGLEEALPTLGALALGAMRLLPMVQKAYEGWAIPKGSKESLVNILNIVNQPIQKHDFSISRSLSFSENIVFNNVNFRYGDKSIRIFEDLNIEIRKGEKIGIIGETGAGKSTVIDLIMGLIIPTSGEILIDGKNIHSKKYPKRLAAWQSSLVHVPQNIYLADTSIAENIVFGTLYEEIDFERLENVCKTARILDFIRSCPDGFKTFVGERGVRLSGGQRQRIGIARALYKKRNFLILDEATSALDTKTESQIMSNLIDTSEEITIIMIAHRINSLKYCDRILSLSNGRFIEKDYKDIKS